MKISKLFYFLNFLLVISLLIPYVRTNNLSYENNDDPLIKLEKELTKEKRKKKAILYTLITLAVLNVGLFFFNIAKQVYKKKSEILEDRGLRKEGADILDIPIYTPKPSFPTQKYIDEAEELTDQYIRTSLQRYDESDANDKKLYLTTLRKKNNFDPNRPYNGITDPREEVRVLSAIFYTNIPNSKSP